MMTHPLDDLIIYLKTQAKHCKRQVDISTSSDRIVRWGGLQMEFEQAIEFAENHPKAAIILMDNARRFM